MKIMDTLNDLIYYNIQFCDLEGKVIESTISLSQPYKEGEEISITSKVDEKYKNNWIQEVDKGALYKIVKIYHELNQHFSEKKTVFKNVWITLKKIKDWGHIKR